MASKKIYYGVVTDTAGPVRDPLGYLTNRPQNEEISSNISERSRGFLGLAGELHFSDYFPAMHQFIRNLKAVEVSAVLQALGLSKCRLKKDNVSKLQEYFEKLIRQGLMEDLEKAIDIWNEYLQSKGSYFRIPLPTQTRDAAVCKVVLDRSAQIRIRFRLPSNYTNVTYCGQPILFTLVPPDYRGKITVPIVRRENSGVHLGVFLKLSNPELFTGPRPLPKTARYRFSFGAVLSRNMFRCSYEARNRIHAIPDFSHNTNVTFSLNTPTPRPIPYYFVAVHAQYNPPIPSASILVNRTGVNQLNNQFLVRSKQSILGKLRQVRDDDVSTATIKLALRCPLSYVRMKKPIRFNNCKHLQCIDEASWASLCSASRSKAFECPLCSTNLNGIYDGFIDGFMVDILENYNENVDEVMVDTENGYAWSPISATPSIEVADTQTNQTICELISDSEAEISMGTAQGVILSDEQVQVLDLKARFDSSSGRPSLPLKRSGASLDDAIEL